MDGKIGVNASQSSKKVTFPSLDIFFSRVSAMKVGRRKLLDKCDGLHVAFDTIGGICCPVFVGLVLFRDR